MCPAQIHQMTQDEQVFKTSQHNRGPKTVAWGLAQDQALGSGLGSGLGSSKLDLSRSVKKLSISL